ncbi:hypothetical protein T484DRAFT_1864481, partial [Baffinella frigidus]
PFLHGFHAVTEEDPLAAAFPSPIGLVTGPFLPGFRAVREEDPLAVAFSSPKLEFIERPFLPGFRAVTEEDPLAAAFPSPKLEFIDHVVGNQDPLDPELDGTAALCSSSALGHD